MSGEIKGTTKVVRSSRDKTFVWNFNLCREKRTLLEMGMTWLRQDRLAVIITPRFRTSSTKGRVISPTLMEGNVIRFMRLTNALLPKTSTLDFPIFTIA